MKTKIAAIYSRDSRDDGSDAFGIDRQTRGSLAYAERYGFTVPKEYIFEEEYTGKEFSRPLFDRLKILIEKHKIDVLIVYKVNRISRIDYHALMFLREYVFRNGVELHIVEWNRRVNDDSQDSMLFGFQALFGHIEREEIVRRTSGGRREKAIQGIALGQGLPPFGYGKDGDKKNTRFYVIPSEAAVVKMIFHLFVKMNASITDIAYTLNAQQYPSPSQARNRIWQKSGWNANSVLRILRDSRYIGEFYAFKYQTYKVEGTNKTRAVLRDKELQIKQYFPDLAVIDRELYNAAQEIIDSRKNRYTFTAKYEYLFNTRIQCACGHKAGVQTMNKNGKSHQYYRCANKRRIGHKNSECKIPYLNSIKLDTDAWNLIEMFIRNPALVLDELRNAQSAQKQQHHSAVMTVESLDRIRKSHTNRLSRLYDDYEEGLITKDVYLKRKKPIDDELAAAERIYQEQQQILDMKVLSDREISRICSECKTIADLLDEYGVLTYEDKKRIIELLNITGEFVIQDRTIKMILYIHKWRVGSVILDTQISYTMAVEYNHDSTGTNEIPITLTFVVGELK